MRASGETRCWTCCPGWWRSRWWWSRRGKRGAALQDAEPVRQYGDERLEESAKRGRHVTGTRLSSWNWRRGRSELEGPDQPRWLDRLDEEHDNIRAALSWLLQQADGAGMALRMCAALGEYWYLRGHIGEGRRWLEGRSRSPLHHRRHAQGRCRGSQAGDRARRLRPAEGAIEEGLGLEGSGLFRTGGGDSIAAELRERSR